MRLALLLWTVAVTVGAGAFGATRTIVYDVTGLLFASGGESVRTLGGGGVSLPSLTWSAGQRVLFEDLVPGANWSHPARYRIVDRQGRVLHEIPVRRPPANLDAANIVQGADLTPSEPATFSLDDFGGRYRVAEPARFHALLVNGQANQRHWNDFAFLYRVLTRIYGYPAAQVHVADTVFRTRRPDLDGDGVADVRYESTIAGVRALAEQLRRGLRREDRLLVVLNDHGDRRDNESTILLDDGELKASEVTALLRPLPPERMLSVFEQCFGGGFVRGSLDRRRVAMAAAKDDEFSFATRDFRFNEFLYHVTSAFARQTHDGRAVAADTDGDGHVSAKEAFAWAVGQDRAAESPFLEAAANAATATRIGLSF